MSTRPELQKFLLSLQLLCLSVVFLLLITLWFIDPVVSQTAADGWLRRGLSGLFITSITADAGNASRLYATSRDTIGVRFSDDEGETWLRYDDGLTDTNIESLIACPSGWLFAGSWGDFVYRRTVNTRWTRSNSGSTELLFIPALACGTGATVFAAISDKGVWRSTDNGENWQVFNQGLTQQAVFSLAYSNGRLFAGTTRGLFERQDNAGNWQLIGLADRSIFSLMITTESLFAATDQGLFRASLTNPTSWTNVGTLTQVVYSMALDGDQRLYAGTRDAGIYRLEGATWQPFNNGLTAKRIYTIRPRGASQSSLLMGTEDGVWINQVQPLPTLTPTVTDTPTVTPTPTITPTPTPGIKAIRLRNEPQGELAGGTRVIYTIELENGPFPLSTVVVSNLLPDGMGFVSDSMRGPTGWVSSITDRTLQWAQATLPAGATAQFSYRAERHTPTSTPTTTLVATVPSTPTNTTTPTGTSEALSTLTPTTTPIPSVSPVATITEMPTASPTKLAISKSGPVTVAVGQEIRYILIVSNHFTRTLTGLTILDLIPVGAEVVDFGGGAITMPPSPMIQWQVPLLNAQRTVTRTFAIRPPTGSSQVINDLYFVDVIENGILRLRAVGKEPVVTTIVGGGLESLPVLSLIITTPLTVTLPIINTGAVVKWEHPGYSNQLTSNRVSNPLQLYLPFVPRE